ncbi:cysteine-rich motor neuron 1 protein [Plakobranchus ocellatus]|uniref:Cysteine-rich motor neuron 1 protein n=1 Tax=Plakobranchus ocellatus TaxID=259542 RepID=A0AAV3XXU0_9GAST|nr:cysteine-rich motor neuron 1 protein [Plakobranchus ocellatus]
MVNLVKLVDAFASNRWAGSQGGEGQEVLEPLPPVVRRCTARVCAPPPSNCHYQANADGCPSCNLICNPADCPALTCPRPCFNGYVKDEKGCNTCVCRPRCYMKACPAECSHGSFTDSEGCPTCQCRPQPLTCHQDIASLCTQGVCPNACACRPFCFPSPQDGGSSPGNTANDFWDYIFATGTHDFLPSSSRKAEIPSFLGIKQNVL